MLLFVRLLNKAIKPPKKITKAPIHIHITRGLKYKFITHEFFEFLSPNTIYISLKILLWIETSEDVSLEVTYNLFSGFKM